MLSTDRLYLISTNIQYVTNSGSTRLQWRGHEMPGRTKEGLLEHLARCGLDSRSERAIVWAWQRE
jgi:hypothetical protein